MVTYPQWQRKTEAIENLLWTFDQMRALTARAEVLKHQNKLCKTVKLQAAKHRVFIV